MYAASGVKTAGVLGVAWGGGGRLREGLDVRSSRSPRRALEGGHQARSGRIRRPPGELSPLGCSQRHWLRIMPFQGPMAMKLKPESVFAPVVVL